MIKPFRKGPPFLTTALLLFSASLLYFWSNIISVSFSERKTGNFQMNRKIAERSRHGVGFSYLGSGIPVPPFR